MDREWALTVVFDDLETQRLVAPELTFPYDECSRAVGRLCDLWGALPEELPEFAEWSDTRLTVTCDQLEPVAQLMEYISMHCVPQSVALTRLGGRL